MCVCVCVYAVEISLPYIYTATKNLEVHEDVILRILNHTTIKRFSLFKEKLLMTFITG